MTAFARASLQGIAVWEGGAGPPMVYLHGGGAADLFCDGTAPFLMAMARRNRVLVPEHPGFGDAERPDWIETVHDLACFYLDFMQAQGSRDVHLVGHGLGGWIALELAIRNTARLSRLTVAGSAGIRVTGIARGDLFLWSPEQAAEALLLDEDARARHLAMVRREMTPAEQREALRNRETAALLARGIGAEYHASGVNPAHSHARFHETHDLIMQAWTQPGPSRFEGRHYDLEYVNIWPTPFQKPHPPIWIPSQGSTETIEVEVAATMVMAEAAAALEMSRVGYARGKIVLTVG